MLDEERARVVQRIGELDKKLMSLSKQIKQESEANEMLARQKDAIRAKQKALKAKVDASNATASKNTSRSRGSRGGSASAGLRMPSLSGEMNGADAASWGSPSPPASSRGGFMSNAYESSNPDIDESK